jgi:hypothetical protein
MNQTDSALQQSNRPQLSFSQRLAYGTLPTLGLVAGLAVSRKLPSLRNNLPGTVALAAGTAALGAAATQVYSDGYRGLKGRFIAPLGALAGAAAGSAFKNPVLGAAVGGALGFGASKWAHGQIDESLKQRDISRISPLLDSIGQGVVARFVPILPDPMKKNIGQAISSKIASAGYNTYRYSKDTQDKLQFAARNAAEKAGIQISKPSLGSPSLAGLSASTAIGLPSVLLGSFAGMYLARKNRPISAVGKPSYIGGAVLGALAGGAAASGLYKGARWAYNKFITKKPYEPPKGDPASYVGPLIGLGAALGTGAGLALIKGKPSLNKIIPGALISGGTAATLGYLASKKLAKRVNNDESINVILPNNS